MVTGFVTDPLAFAFHAFWAPVVVFLVLRDGLGVAVLGMLQHPQLKPTIFLL